MVFLWFSYGFPMLTRGYSGDPSPEHLATGLPAIGTASALRMQPLVVNVFVSTDFHHVEYAWIRINA